MLLFCAIVVLQLAVINPTIIISDSTDIYGNELIAVIKQFEKYTHTTSGAIKNEGNMDSNHFYGYPIPRIEMTSRVLQKFENEILVIFRQFNNSYLQKISISKNNPREKRYELQYMTYTPSEYEETICSLMPRLLDFLNISSPRPKIYYLYNFLSMFCKTLPCFVGTIRSDSKTGCAVKLRGKRSMLPTCKNIVDSQKTYDVYMEDDYKEIGIKFIRNVYELINGIDRTPIIRHNFRRDQDMFERGIHKYPVWKVDSILKFYDASYQRRDKIEGRIRELNNDYRQKMVDHCDASIVHSDSETVDNSTTRTLNAMLIYTLKRIEKYFKFEIVGKRKERSTGQERTSNVDRQTVKDLVVNTLNGLCEHAPLILVYLKDNNANDEDTQLFDLYLTLCADHMVFINDRCRVQMTSSTTTDNNMYDLNCVTESMKDKLEVNFFTITQTVSDYDEHVNNKYCTDVNFGYVEDIYKTVSEYYDLVINNWNEFPIHVWTSFSWLSGKHFLTEDFGKSVDLNEIKKIKLLQNGESYVTLSEAYCRLLPWNTNMNTVLIFHNAISFQLNETLNEYVYRHAKLIVMYFQHVKDNVKSEIYDNLKESVNWYKPISVTLHKYLSLPGKHLSLDNVQTIIFEVQNIDPSDGTGKIINAFPNGREEGLTKWAKIKLQNISNRNYIKRLNKMAMDNCMDALNFIHTFLAIVQKSLVMSKVVTSTFNKSYCKDNNMS